MSEKITAELRFGVRLVEHFAALSGDANPIHVDRIAARRLMFGGRVAHGTLSVLWALSCLRAARLEITGLRHIRAKFRAPVRVGAHARLEITGDGSAWRAVIRAGGRTCATLMLETTDGPLRTFDADPVSEDMALVCRELDDAALATAAGRFGVSRFCPEALFAGLAGFDPDQCGLIAGLSRLVGMECPGRHSTFVGFDVAFLDTDDTHPHIDYRVVAYEPRFRLMTMAISGGMQGVVESIVRPAPVAQPTLAALSVHFPHPAFVGQNALVLGGSRGLGEVVAKCFAVGGGACALSYHMGAGDAAQVVNDINGQFEDAANAIHWDVQRAPPRLEGSFSHAFYLASPRIAASRPGRFDEALYRAFKAFYVDPLETVIDRFATVAADAAVFVYVSIVYVEDTPAGFEEYANAKREGEAAAEMFCRSHGIRYRRWRPPQLLTDQTAGYLDSDAPNTGQIVADFLRRLMEIESR